MTRATLAYEETPLSAAALKQYRGSVLLYCNGKRLPVTFSGIPASVFVAATPYNDGATARIAAAALPSDVSSPPPTVSARPAVGSRVKIVSSSDSKERIGQEGELIEDDHGSMPFRVRFSSPAGRLWFHEHDIVPVGSLQILRSEPADFKTPCGGKYCEGVAADGFSANGKGNVEIRVPSTPVTFRVQMPR